MASVHELEAAEVERGVIELKVDDSSKVRVAVVANDALPVTNFKFRVKGFLGDRIIVEFDPLEVGL